MSNNNIFSFNLIDKKQSSGYLYQWLMTRYGVGKFNALTICSLLGFSSLVGKAELSNVELYEIQQFMEANLKLDSFLKKGVYLDIDKLIKIKSYRGLRHKEGLPVRGQLSRSNGRTQRKLKSLRFNI